MPPKIRGVVVVHNLACVARKPSIDENQTLVISHSSFMRHFLLAGPFSSTIQPEAAPSFGSSITLGELGAST